MRQSKLGSMIEVLVNILIGFAINFVANMFILPYFGFDISFGTNIKIGLAYTIVSIVRSYVIRRYFEKLLHAASQKVASKIEG